MKSYRSHAFNKLLAQLPKHVQEQARTAYKLFKRDPIIPVFTSNVLILVILSIQSVLAHTIAL